MTRRAYRWLKMAWLLGSAAMALALVGGWLRLLPFGAVFLAILVFGGAAAIAAWVVRDQKFEELPD